MNQIMYAFNKSMYVALHNTLSQSGGRKKHDKSIANQDKEIEWRWIDIDINNIRKLLKRNNAELVFPKTIMPLMVFTHPTGKKDSYIRIRYEGDHVTFTSKTDLRSNYVTEYEVIIDSFEQGVKILKSLGCKKRYYVEKLRETWKLPGCKEIVIDSYPGSREYLEIDAYNENALKKTAQLLGLKKPTFPLPNVNTIYENDYGIPHNRKTSGGDFTFKNAYNKDKKDIKKNKSMFKKILKKQQKYYEDLDFDVKKILKIMKE